MNPSGDDMASEDRGVLSDDQVAAAVLASLDRLGPVGLCRMLRHDRPAALLDGLRRRDQAMVELLRRCVAPAHVDAVVVAARRADASRLRAACGANGIGITWHGGPGFPVSLAHDPAPPSVLFSRGDLSYLERPTAAVIGTRNATSAGRDLAAELGHDLATAGVSVVSGLARGIDGAAHRGALAASAAPAIGVVASGLDVVYPPEHRGLWAAVASRGLLLSEAPPGTHPHAWRFPARNRVLAAIADVVVVVESRASGGSLITANEAARRGVSVMAVPGSPRNRAAEGVNHLLVDGCPPVLDAGDVLVALGLERPTPSGRRRDRRPSPDPADVGVLELLGTEPCSLDELATRSDLALHELAAALGRLESAGWLRRADAWYERAEARP